MKRISAIVIFLLLLSVTGGLAQELMIISEENPPFNFIKDGIFTGSSTEVVREIMRRLNLPGEIQVLPWARAYQLALSQPNVVLFSTARTTERKHLFHWVGPIYKVRFGFYARKGSGLYLSCLAVAKKWQATLDEMKREGTFRKISQQWLPEESIPRIRPVAAKSGIAPVTLRIYTENSPPASYLDHGKLKGRSVEIVREILHRLKLPDNIQAREISLQDEVTVRKHAEEKIRQSEAKGRALLDAMPDMMFQLDRNGYFLEYHGTQQDLYRAPDTFLGKKIDDVLPADLAELQHAKTEQALSTRQLQIFEYD